MKLPKAKLEVRLDDNKEVDEVLLYVNGWCHFHLERMEDGFIWIGLYENDKKDTTHHVRIHTARAKIKVDVDKDV